MDVVDGALQSDYFAWKTNNHLQAPDKFNDMLQDQALLAAYYQYAAKKFMANEVEFILKIDDYKRNPTWDKARSIVAVFLNPQSKMHANVHGDIENYIRECIKDKRAPFKDKEYRD